MTKDTKINIDRILLRRCRIPYESDICFFCLRQARNETESGIRMCSKCVKNYTVTDGLFQYVGVNKNNIFITTL